MTKTSTEDQILAELRQSDDAFMTAPEIAENLGMTRQAVTYNLKNLHERGRVGRKEAGSRAVGWWLKD